VRADDDAKGRYRGERAQRLLRDPQFGGRAAPEEITRGRRDDQAIGTERRDAARQLVVR
jgi:hypothetical protein